MAPPALLRCCALLLGALLAVACADDSGGQADDAPDQTDQTDDAADDATAGDGSPETDDADESAEAGGPDANLTACVDDGQEGVDYFPEQVTFDHAETVEVAYEDSYKVLDVELPFQEAPARYVLVQCGLDAPELEGELAEAQVIEVPVTAAVTMTTTNLPHFDALDAVDRLVGVSDPALVSTPSVRDAAEAGDIQGFGDAEGTPDLERVIAAEPDALILDAFGETVLDTATRVSEGDVPVLFNTDFEETSLLARAEWVKVTSLLLNAEAAASAEFDGIRDAYEETAALVADAEQRPLVLHGEPFEGTWFAPGGRSVTAHAIAEAGGEYVFADDESTESVPFDIETVLDQGTDADVWIAAGSVHGTLEDLAASDERFAQLQAFQEGEVWAGDAATTPEGGNARFEEAYLRADLMLADLAAIFHPDLVEDHDPIFYGRVGEG